ncbi:acyltransferase family protein [Mesorhizobium sp. KR1-2]|uniref:acyltransferase family protein n=1 Tax=Mesorhizobium sp. KR1-2 TaxID=3156609 RepID=UPI0032B4F53F
MGLQKLAPGRVASLGEDVLCTDAAYPCLGAALIIWPKSSTTVAARLLSLEPATFVGKISYSLYLWHWPTIVLFRHYANGDRPEVHEAVFLIFITFLLSWISWRCVEEPMRKLRRPKLTVSIGALSVGTVVALGWAIMASDGAASRLSPGANALRSYGAMWDWPCPSKTVPGLNGNVYCVVGAPWAEAERRRIVWVDSNAIHLGHLLDIVGPERNIAFLAIWHACPPFIDGAFRQSGTCQAPGLFRKVRGEPPHSAPVDSWGQAGHRRHVGFVGRDTPRRALLRS